MNQQKPHPPHEVLVSKKNFHCSKLFHCIPYELIFLKKLKCKKNRTHMKKLGHTSYLLNFKKHQKSEFLKNKIKKKKKNCWRYYHFTHVYHKSQLYEVYSTWDTKNEKMKFKKKKKSLEVPPFYTGVSKIMIGWCTVFEIWCATDGWIDRQTEKVTYRGECPT